MADLEEKLCWLFSEFYRMRGKKNLRVTASYCHRPLIDTRMKNVRPSPENSELATVSHKVTVEKAKTLANIEFLYTSCNIMRQLM